MAPRQSSARRSASTLMPRSPGRSATASPRSSAGPVEDFRIDFEDGYGNRPDAEEDGHAAAAAAEVARGHREGLLPPCVGIRINRSAASFETCNPHARSIRDDTRLRGGPDAHQFRRHTAEDHSRGAGIRARRSPRGSGTKLPAGTLRLELMIETTESVLGLRGECAIPGLVEAARRRCRGAHFGTYDYTASCQITALIST